MNRTGFPSPKKKKVSIKNQEINNLSPKVKLDKNLVMNNLKSHSGSNDFSSKSSKSEDGVAKKKVPKQLKLDRFITKQQKPKSSHSENGSDDETANSRRSAAMKAKNYRWLSAVAHACIIPDFVDFMDYFPEIYFQGQFSWLPDFSELESDTESLLEVSIGGSVKSLTGKKQKSDTNSKSKKK